MSRNASFVRKVIYIGAIALLLLPLSALSQPSTISPDGLTRGGVLSQMRTEYGIAQAELGEIDPASETMKLATLGLRGVAADILWIQANHYKMVEDWDKLEATVEQIIRLQPNFLEVWDFQAHNLTYNVSVEFDDYRFRYVWVKKGIEFLILGTQYNRDEPSLFHTLGWYVGQKVGRADESKQFRRMFRDDRDFHALFRKHGVDPSGPDALGPDGKPDNWLTSRLWFLRGEDAVVSSGKPIRGRTPLLFYDGAPKSLMNGADAMQKDGWFFGRPQSIWQKALAEWETYGKRDIPTSAGFNIHLNGLDAVQRRLDEAKAQIDELAPGVREKIRQEKIAQLDKKEAEWLGRADEATRSEELMAATSAERKTQVTNEEITDRAPRENRPRIRALAEQIADQTEVLHFTNNYRGIVNYEFWHTRCLAEKEDLTQQAHKDVYEADRLKAAGEHYTQAKEQYERAFKAWGQVFDKYPVLMGNAETKELINSVQRYNELLGQLEADFPADFPLVNFLKEHHEGEKLLEQIRLLGDSSEKNKAEEKKSDEKTTDEKTSDDTKDTKADEKKSDEKKSEAKKSDEKKPAADKATDKADDETKQDADKKASDENKSDSKKPDEKNPDADKSNADKSDVKKSDEKKDDDNS